MNMNPTVSVFMTVYNGAKYLRPSIDSLLAQTFPDFELIVVDDGSTDGSAEIIRNIGDPRVRLIQPGQHIGRTPALNVALRAARGLYAACQDADDFSLPDRLERQVAFLNENTNICVVGGWCDYVTEDGHPVRTAAPPVSHPEIVNYSVKDSPFIHSTVMFRLRPIVDLGGYPEEYRFAQDCALWLKVIRTYATANLPRVLAKRLIHPEQLTQVPELSTVRTEEKIRLLRFALTHPGLPFRARYAGRRAVAEAFLRHAEALSENRRPGAAWRFLTRFIFLYPDVWIVNASHLWHIGLTLLGPAGRCRALQMQQSIRSRFTVR